MVIMEALVTRIPYTLLHIHSTLSCIHASTYEYTRCSYSILIAANHRGTRLKLSYAPSPRLVPSNVSKKKKKKMRKKKRKKNTARVLLHFITEQSIGSATISTIFSFYNNAFYFTCSSNLRRMKNDKKIVYERSKASCKYFSKSTLYTFQRPPCRLS